MNNIEDLNSKINEELKLKTKMFFDKKIKMIICDKPFFQIFFDKKTRRKTMNINNSIYSCKDFDALFVDLVNNVMFFQNNL